VEYGKTYKVERGELIERLFSEESKTDADLLQLDVFRFQYAYNMLYKTWCDYLGKQIRNVDVVEKIPHLPISFFKYHSIQTGIMPTEKTFRSSGTGGSDRSIHSVRDLSIYRNSALSMFEAAFGKPSDYVFVGLLPSYLERDDSSLIYMCKILMEASGRSESGFYLDQYELLNQKLMEMKASGLKVWLIGVSFALLDFAAYSPPVWPGLTVVETGGMKGRKEEMVREALHLRIRQSWPLKNIYAEYGMTELLSQAYAGADGWFSTPPWMKVRIRDSYDPFTYIESGRTGGINVADLANIDSCAFIATDDLGLACDTGEFKVLGRFDHAEQRGCNLLLL
jgi:hypothetical protein